MGGSGDVPSVELLMREPVYGTHNGQQSVVDGLRALAGEGSVPGLERQKVA